MNEEEAFKSFLELAKRDSLTDEELEMANSFCLQSLGLPWRKYIVRKEVQAMDWPDTLPASN